MNWLHYDYLNRSSRKFPGFSVFPFLSCLCLNIHARGHSTVDKASGALPWFHLWDHEWVNYVLSLSLNFPIYTIGTKILSHRWLQRWGAGVWEASSTVPGTHWTFWSCGRRQGIKHITGLCVRGGGGRAPTSPAAGGWASQPRAVRKYKHWVWSLDSSLPSMDMPP